MKLYRKNIISVLMAICLILVSFPLSVSASEKTSASYDFMDDVLAVNSEIDQAAASAEMERKKGTGVVEIESLREEKSKHFQLDDGSYQAVSYDAPIHRRDENGRWQDIDNRLYLDNKNHKYSTLDGRFSFADNVNDKNLYTIDDGSFKIEFGIITGVSIDSSARIYNHADRSAIAETLSEREKLSFLKSIDNTTKVRYSSIQEGIDLDMLYPETM